MSARFRVKFHDGWISCFPLNKKATEIINGKKIALWPGPRIPEPYVPFVFDKRKKAQSKP